MLLRVAACSYEGSLFGWDINQSSKSSMKEVADAETTEKIEVFLLLHLPSVNGFLFTQLFVLISLTTFCILIYTVLIKGFWSGIAVCIQY